MSNDPNRYAEGPEALAIRLRIEDEELALDVLRTKYDRAQQAHRETQAKFQAIEEQYQLYKGLLAESDKYVGKCQSQYDAQMASVALERVFLHPVRKTPLDVLGYIFEYCLDDIPCSTAVSVETAATRKRQWQPFQLAAVCRRWRQASLSHPRAWSCLEWTFDSIKLTNLLPWTAFTDAVLSRARSAPLTVCLTRRGESKPYHEDFGKKIGAAMRRCVRAQIHVSCLRDGDTLLPILTSATPKLLDIRIELARSVGSHSTQLLPDAPALRYIHADQGLLAAPINFPCVRKASFHGIKCTSEQDTLAAILHSLPQLENLRLALPSIAYDVSNQEQRLTFRQVKELELHVTSAGPVDQLTFRFEFPCLTWLVLYGNPSTSGTRLMLLRTLAQKSAIRTLYISDIGDPSFASFLDILPSLGSLQVLLFERTAFTQHNLLALHDALCPKDVSKSDWPCKTLQGIRFLNASTFADDCDPTILLDMIHSRASAAKSNVGSGLRPFALFLVDGWEISGTEPLQDRIDRAIRTAA